MTTKHRSRRALRQIARSRLDEINGAECVRLTGDGPNDVVVARTGDRFGPFTCMADGSWGWKPPGWVPRTDGWS